MSRIDIAMFVGVVFVWGTSWILISLQLGDVDVAVSVLYRFAISAVVMFAIVLWRQKNAAIPKIYNQPFIVAIAVCMFSVNYILFYYSAYYITTGLMAVIFSLTTIFNCINAKIFFNEQITKQYIIGSFVGVTALVCIFGPDIYGEFKDTNEFGNTAIGVGLSSFATMMFSLGNMSSRRLSAMGVAPMNANAWGMLYGTIILLVYIAITNTPIVAPPSVEYTLALISLAVVATVIGFTLYLTLIARIGSSKTAYTTVLYPIVAIGISAVFENFQITWLTLVGLGLAIAGNVIIFSKGK